MKLTKNNITPEMFNSWLDEMKEHFKNNKESMNLINLYLIGLEKDSTNINAKNGLYDLYLNDLCHNNKLYCEHCGNKMEVYYTVKCFYCDESKPQIKDNELNLLECLRWFENQENIDYDENEIWDILLDNDIIPGNDTYTKLKSQGNNKYNLFITEFIKYFPINVIYFVSW